VFELSCEAARMDATFVRTESAICVFPYFSG
jgi:hypothetical protein